MQNARTTVKNMYVLKTPLDRHIQDNVVETARLETYGFTHGSSPPFRVNVNEQKNRGVSLFYRYQF